MPHVVPQPPKAVCLPTCGKALPIQLAASCPTRSFDQKVIRHRHNRPARTQATKEAHVPAVTPAPESATWDPEGLLSRIPAGSGHFARRERQKSGQASSSGQTSPDPAYPPAGSSNAFKAQLRSIITHIPEQHAQQGIPASQQDLYDRSALQHSLESDYVPVNLEHAGMVVQCLEPPVLTVDAFMTPEQCQQLAQAAEATGLMQTSKIGEGSVESGAVSVNERRTSSTVLLDPTVVEQNPELQPMVLQLQAKAQKLLSIGAWTVPGRLPPPGQFCFESLQVACYQPGQHFLQHEDAFPPNFVRDNRFQRQATLLVYLNDVATGGMTHFDRLGLSIQPQCGKALLFFPAFADGTPDPRTVHTAHSPETTKWVTQVWIAGGHPLYPSSQAQASSSLPGLASSSDSSPDTKGTEGDDDMESKILSRRKKGTKGKSSNKKKQPVSRPKRGFS